ncbi:MAG: 30S ribosomal protein S1 [Chloroflexi bacterium]|nr:30S ribosomal protein S1 [Chloroflexota bacterium]
MVSAGGPNGPQEADAQVKDVNPQSANGGDKMSDFAEADYGYKRVKYGDIVAGTVVRVDPGEILIDIGTKSEGVVPQREFEAMSPEALKKIQVGDRVLAFVLKPEDSEGNVLLSLTRAQLERDWREAEQLLKSEEVFEAQVAGFNKGGLIVRVGKVRGFVPATQLESIPRRRAEGAAHTPHEGESNEADLSALVGKKLKFKIIELDRARNRLILSERAAMRDWRKEQKERLLNELKEGDVRSGVVTSVTDFGAFVSLGGVDGLIHLSELSWAKINHPRDLLKVGDKVDVKVLSVDRERQRVALSLKRMQAEPWSTVEERYQVGQLVTGTITKLASFGAFARLEDNIEGLIHISELSDRRIQHPKEVVKEGDSLTLRVIRIDPARRRLGLSLKRVAEDDYTAYGTDLDNPVEEWPESGSEEPQSGT